MKIAAAAALAAAATSSLFELCQIAMSLRSRQPLFFGLIIFIQIIQIIQIIIVVVVFILMVTFPICAVRVHTYPAGLRRHYGSACDLNRMNGWLQISEKHSYTAGTINFVYLSRKTAPVVSALSLVVDA